MRVAPCGCYTQGLPCVPRTGYGLESREQDRHRGVR